MSSLGVEQSSSEQPRSDASSPISFSISLGDRSPTPTDVGDDESPADDAAEGDLLEDADDVGDDDDPTVIQPLDLDEPLGVSTTAADSAPPDSAPAETGRTASSSVAVADVVTPSVDTSGTDRPATSESSAESPRLFRLSLDDAPAPAKPKRSLFSRSSRSAPSEGEIDPVDDGSPTDAHTAPDTSATDRASTSDDSGAADGDDPTDLEAALERRRRRRRTTAGAMPVETHNPAAAARASHLPDQSALAAQRQRAAQRAAMAVPPSAAVARGRQAQRNTSGFGLLFTLLLLAVLIGGGILFGRDLLFPDDWDADARRYADAVADVRGVDFAEPFAVTAEPVDEHRARVCGQVLGSWESELPMWRALGLAASVNDVASVEALVDERSPALYSWVDGQIYHETAADPFERDEHVTRAAVEASLDQQFSWSVDQRLRSLDERALVDAHVLARTDVVQAASVFADPVSPPDHAAAATLPAILDYRLTAPAVFSDLLDEADVVRDIALEPAGPDDVDPLSGLGPDGPGPVFQAPYAVAPAAFLEEGERVADDPIQLDPAVWFMTFAAHTDAVTADRMTRSITAATLLPIATGEERCWAATFEPVTDEVALVAFTADLGRWVQSAPPAHAARLSTQPDGTLQLRTCDPGPGSAMAVPSGLARQLVAQRAVHLATTVAVGPDVDPSGALAEVAAANVVAEVAALSADTAPAEIADLARSRVATVLGGPTTAPDGQVVAPGTDGVDDPTAEQAAAAPATTAPVPAEG